MQSPKRLFAFVTVCTVKSYREFKVSQPLWGWKRFPLKHLEDLIHNECRQEVNRQCEMCEHSNKLQSWPWTFYYIMPDRDCVWLASCWLCWCGAELWCLPNFYLHIETCFTAYAGKIFASHPFLSETLNTSEAPSGFAIQTLSFYLSFSIHVPYDLFLT